MYRKIIQYLLRLTLSIGFLSAVADRLGWWTNNIAWGNWDNFLSYTHQLLPWVSETTAHFFGWAATVLEIGLAIFLLMGWKTRFFAIISGILLMSFAVAMTFSGGVKTALDASVFTAAVAAFALSTMKGRFFELDNLFHPKTDEEYNVILKHKNNE